MNKPLGTNNYQGKRIYDMCKNKVEDEQNFILESKLNEIFVKIYLVTQNNFQLRNETEKTKYFFETAGESTLQKFAKFVSNYENRKYSNKA